jgi:hypothetical protein
MVNGLKKVWMKGARAMSEEAYVLKKKASCDVLAGLNDRDRWTDIEAKTDMVNNLYRALETSGEERITIDQVENWISALKSGKKIVNPLSPKEELEMYLTDRQEEAKYPSGDDVRIRVIGIKQGVKKAIEIISKEHPDVADWLKDVNEHG